MSARIISEKKNRQTGTTIQVIDRGLDDFERAEAAEQGIEWLRWETICIEHGSVCSHPRRRLAEAFAAVPREWCEACQA